MMAKAKPKKKRRQRRERSPESEEDDFRTFNLQRINPEAHRLQSAEFELLMDILMDTARHVHKTMSQQEIKKLLRRPTWALRKWRRENLKHGHVTWREDFSLLQVMRGNDAQALHDDQGDCSVTVSESEDDEPIARVCRQKPTEDKNMPDLPGFKDRHQWCEEAEKLLQAQASSGPDHQSSKVEFPKDISCRLGVSNECIWVFPSLDCSTTHG